MEDGPSHERDPNSMRKRGASSPMNRPPLPLELMEGVKGALEGKLGNRESPDNLMARNILRAHPTTAGRVSAGAQELKWKQTQDTIESHLKDKLTNNKEPPVNVTQDSTSFQERQDAVKQVLDTREARTDLVKRGVIVETEQTEPDAVSPKPAFPRSGRRRSDPSLIPVLQIPQSPVSTPSQSPATSPFSNVRRKRASSLILPGSRSTTPVHHEEEEPTNTSHVRIARNYTHLLATEARGLAHSFVSTQMSQNGMMVQRLEGEVGIPHICSTGDYVWVGYKGGTVIAFQSLCMEPNEDLRQDPDTSSSYIRALISVGTHVWCGHASGEIQIWDGLDGEHLNTINAHPGVGVSALFYSERSGQVWSGGGDGKLCVWTTSGKPYGRRIGQSHAGAVRIIAQIGDHVWTISDSLSGAFLWADHHVHNHHPAQPNGSSPYNAANGKPSRVSRMSPVPFSARSPTPPRKIKESHRDADENPASVVHLGPGVLCLLAVPHLEGSNTLLWAGTSEGLIRVIDPGTKEVVRTLSGHTGQVNTLLLVGAHIWSAANDKSIRIWSAKSMELLRTISDAHTSAIYSLCLSGSHVWSGSTDRSVRVWLAAGAHELLGTFLETALQGIYDLEARQRKGEERIAQSEAYAKQNAEEAASLRLKLKTQAGEALNAKHEMELLAQEVASVDQWQRKMQALKAVYHSDKAVLKDKLAKAHDFIDQQDAEMYDMREKLREADANVYRLQSERNAMEAEARELALLLQKAESDAMEHVARVEQLERKEKEDYETRKRLEAKVRESQENEARLRQSILLLEKNFTKSMQKSSSRSGNLNGKVPNLRRRSSTIGYGETPNLPPIALGPDLSELGPGLTPPFAELGPGPGRPYIPRLRLGSEARSARAMSAKSARAASDESDTVRMGDSEESTLRETEDEGEIEVEEGGREGEEEEETDVTVSLVDVLGMVKYKGERTTALQERIHKLTQKLQELHHKKYVQQLQHLHQQQLAQIQKQKGEREKSRRGETGGVGWMVVFVILVGGLGIILFMLRKNTYFSSSLHPS